MKPPKEFNIYGEVTIQVCFNVEANTEEEARRKAMVKLEDFYHLDSNGAPHDPEHGVEHRWDVYDEDPEDNDDEN